MNTETMRGELRVYNRQACYHAVFTRPAIKKCKECDTSKGKERIELMITHHECFTRRAEPTQFKILHEMVDYAAVALARTTGISAVFIGSASFGGALHGINNTTRGVERPFADRRRGYEYIECSVLNSPAAFFSLFFLLTWLAFSSLGHIKKGYICGVFLLRQSILRH